MTDPMTAAVPDPTLEGKIAGVLGRHEARWPTHGLERPYDVMHCATPDCNWSVRQKVLMSDDDCYEAHRAHLAAVLAPLVVEVRERAVEEALNAAADELEWVRPEVCPCANPEACCGSEESCDAMQPSVRVVGADWLRARIVRAGGRP